jgi:hypothetical protein
MFASAIPSNPKPSWPTVYWSAKKENRKRSSDDFIAHFAGEELLYRPKMTGLECGENDNSLPGQMSRT